MDDGAFRQVVEAARDCVRAELRRSEEFRRLVDSLARWLSAEVQALRDEQARPPAPEAPDPAPTSPPASAATVTLRIGDAATHVRVAGTTQEIGRARAAAGARPADEPLVHPLLEEGARVDLGLVERRCRLKAESCRVFLERRASAGDPLREPALVEQVSGLLNRGKALPGCFLWVLWRERTQPGDAALQLIARCYEALAAAASLVASCEAAAPAEVAEAMQLLAEANSALRVALRATWLSSPDTDQDEVHAWLSRETAIRRILIGRHMRLDDPADPAAADRILADVAALREQVAESAAAEKKIVNLLGKVRYHARNVESAGAAAPHDAQRICDAIEALAAMGIPPSDRRIIESLRPIGPGAFPPEVVIGPAVARALNALPPRAVAPGEDAPAGPEERIWSAAVLEVRGLLAGTSVVVIGGERRPDAADRIREAFSLSDLEWVRLSEHGSGAAMRAPIERPGTSLVLVLIKLAGHLHSEEAAECSRRAGKPCVFLKAGYNPEQIADAVLKQAGERMRLA